MGHVSRLKVGTVCRDPGEPSPTPGPRRASRHESVSGARARARSACYISAPHSWAVPKAQGNCPAIWVSSATEGDDNICTGPGCVVTPWCFDSQFQARGVCPNGSTAGIRLSSHHVKGCRVARYDTNHDTINVESVIVAGYPQIFEDAPNETICATWYRYCNRVSCQWLWRWWRRRSADVLGPLHKNRRRTAMSKFKLSDCASRIL